MSLPSVPSSFKFEKIDIGAKAATLVAVTQNIFPDQSQGFPEEARE